MKNVVVFLLMGVFGFCLFGVWESVVFLNSGTSQIGQEKVYEIPPGAGFFSIAERLEKDGLISSALYFKIFAKLSGYSDRLKVGEYALRSDMRPIEILKVLASGKSIEHPITFPEGITAFEMAGIAEQKGLTTRKQFMEWVQKPALIQELLGEKLPSLEGYLFPETYQYTKYTTTEAFIRSMVRRFLEVYGPATAESTVKLNRHQLVTMASVIEKESGSPQDRGKIASVFHNRLKVGMRLQSDPTILYGLFMETGQMPNNIRREDILHPTPYNTYTINALPIGPIGNPGRDSLAVAAHPPESEFLFFVSRNDGTTTFSKNLSEHNHSVQKFQVNKNAREGKSWRDLKKKRAN